MKVPCTIVIASLALSTSGCAGLGGPSIDARIPSNPDTWVWGQLPVGRLPVLAIRSGQTVEIDTVSHQGLINGTDPVSFFGAQGVAAGEVLPDAIEIYRKVQRSKDAGAHVLTGPIAVEGAEPGDMLEVRMVDFKFRTPYGVNNSNKGTGVLPELHAKPYPKVIRFDTARRVALFAPGIEVPLVPFMGIMAVMPPEALANTRPPGIYGGNMDFNRLTVGARLYLPVHQRGAQIGRASVRE